MKIDVVNSDGIIENVDVHVNKSIPWTILVFDKGGLAREYKADDLFEALRLWRVDVECNGGTVLCAGSQRNVTPSGMSRSMNGGRKAWVVEVGRQAENMVDIFDKADLSDIGTVEEQTVFIQRWFASIR